MPDEESNNRTFESSSGVQGGNEGPNLFNLFLEYATRAYASRDVR